MRAILIIGLLSLVGIVDASDKTQSRAKCLALIEEADSLAHVGNLELARVRALESVEFGESKLDRTDNVLGRAYATAGLVHWSLLDYASAEASWLRAKEIQEHSLPASHPEIAQTVANLGSVNFAQGRVSTAASYFERALLIYRKSLGDHHHAVAVVANNLASLYADAGRFSLAEPLFKEAIAIRQDELGDDHPAVAASLRDLGNSYLEQARYGDAEDAYQRALDILNKAYLPSYPNSPEIGKTMRCIGRLYAASGRIDEAEFSLEKALDILQGSLGDSHPDVAQVLVDIAMLEFRQGHLRTADSLVSNAQSIYGQYDGMMCDEAVCMSKRAVISAMLGESSAAVSLFEHSKSALDSLLPADHPLTMQCYHDFATYSSMKGNHTQARTDMEQVFTNRRDVFISDAETLPERVAFEYAGSVQQAASSYLTILLNGRDSIAAWEEEFASVTLASKGLVTEIIADRYRAGDRREDGSISALHDSLARARHALANLRLNRPVVVDGAYLKDLSDASAAKERFETKLAELSADFREHRVTNRVFPRQIMAALPSNSAGVDFVKYAHATGFLAEELRYVAVVWLPDSLPIVVELGRADSIESAIAWYRYHFEYFESQNHDSYDAIADNLYRLIWKPFESLIESASSIFVSPDSELNLVSFAGLKSPEGRFLIEKHAIYNVATMREIYLHRARAEYGNAGLLTLGNPDFGAGGKPRKSLPSVATAERRWESLEGSRLETERIAAMSDKKFERVDVLTGSQASEEYFRQRAPGKQVIHIATHGYFADADTRRNKAESVTEIRVVQENPFVQSGLVLAGANNSPHPNAGDLESDGFLTAEEIVGLNLQGTDLVILSACRSALGDIKAGEGVFGLTRAFELAGAGTVVSALWRVPDAETAELIPEFACVDLPLTPEKSQSILLSRIRALKSGGHSTHPYYWASFVVSGSWR